MQSTWKITDPSEMRTSQRPISSSPSPLVNSMLSELKGSRFLIPNSVLVIPSSLPIVQPFRRDSLRYMIFTASRDKYIMTDEHK